MDDPIFNEFVFVGPIYFIIKKPWSDDVVEMARRTLKLESHNDEWLWSVMVGANIHRKPSCFRFLGQEPAVRPRVEARSHSNINRNSNDAGGP